MGFWVFMFICDLLLPAIMITFGFAFIRNPPKQINGLYGCRTARSMKNADTWAFAHAMCGRIWRRVGFVLLIASAVAGLFALPLENNGVGVAGIIMISVQLVVMIVSIIPVERALKRNFDENGEPKAAE